MDTAPGDAERPDCESVVTARWRGWLEIARSGGGRPQQTVGMALLLMGPRDVPVTFCWDD